MLVVMSRGAAVSAWAAIVGAFVDDALDGNRGPIEACDVFRAALDAPEPAWTSEQPTEPGWYRTMWFAQPRVAELLIDGTWWYGDRCWDKVDLRNARFWPVPIDMPDAR